MAKNSSHINVFLAEFKRRNVSKLITVYAVVGLGIIDATDIIGGSFMLPNWFIRIVIISVVAGFPIAITLSWIFDLTLKGVKKTEKLTQSQKESLPGFKFRFNWFTITGLAVIVFFLFVFYTIPRPNMIGYKGNDWILLSDLENNTGNEVFDLSLKSALIITIDQSKYISLYPKAKINEALKRMELASDTHIDPDIALEMAERENIKVVLSLSISEIGGSYILTTRLLSPVDEEIVISRQANADSEDDILEALNKLANLLRKDLGESHYNFKTNNLALAKATTQSLEALRYHALAYSAWQNQDLDESEELYLKAIELDPEFAIAHSDLGTLYYWESDRENGDKHFNIALSLLDRLTEKEKLRIKGEVEQTRGNRLEAIETWRIYLKKYPTAYSAWFYIGYNNMRLNKDRDAIEAFKQFLVYEENNAGCYINIAACYGKLKMYKESIDNYLLAFKLKPEYIMVTGLNHEFAFIYVASGEYDKAIEVLNKLLGGNEKQRAQGHRSKGLLFMYLGRYSLAVSELQESINLYQSIDYKLSEFRSRLFLACILRDKGLTKEFREELEIAENLLIATSAGPAWYLYLGKVYARDKDLEKAELLLERMIPLVNDGNISDESALYQFKGEIELLKGNNDEALSLFERANSLEKNSYTVESIAHYYYSTGDLDKAITSYEEIIGPLALLGWEGQEAYLLALIQLGKLYSEKGEVKKAVSYIEKFLEIWENADKDIPLYIETKSLLEDLKAGI